jgi:uncharacterized caspase-like protein
MKRIASLLIFVTLTLAGLAPPESVVAGLSHSPGKTPEHRVALVIGNNDYPEAPLANAVNDARLVARALTAAGFQVYDGYDLDRTDTSILIDKYLAALSKEGVGLFYFAGIAKEVGGRNYMLPTDVRFTSEGVRADGLPLDQLQLRLDALTRVKLLFVDSCRDDPFGASAASALPAPRIARPGPETFIGFATESGELAFDGDDGHSPFAQALVHHLQQPGLELGPMFARMRRDVAAATDDRQLPMSFSSLTDPFYFLPAASTVANVAVGAFPQPAIPAVPVIEAPDHAAYDPEQRGVPIAGRVISDDLAALAIEGDEVAVAGNGEFNYLLVGLSRGEERTVAIRAVDRAGYQAEHIMQVSRTVERRPTAVQGALDPRKLRGKLQPDAVALVIGVESYGDLNLPPARFAAADAKRFADYAEWVLGVPAHRIALLTDDQATAGTVLSEVRGTLLRARQEGPIGAAYVFFSGHGLDINGAPHLLAYDYNEYAVERTAIAIRDLVAWVGESEPESITLFADSCFSGQTRDSGVVVADARALRAGAGAATLRESRAAVLSAAGDAGLSMSLAGVGHGAFSYVLMRGLGGEADADRDRAVTLVELEAWTARELPKLALTPSGPQRPSYNGVDPGRVLARLE